MNTVIRQEMFEGNSSSSHVVSINRLKPDDILSTMGLDEECNVVLKGGEFGWDRYHYYDAQHKASYLALYLKDWVSGFTKDEWTEIFESVIKEQTGCNAVIYDMGKGSYIDHQSVEDGQLDHLFKDPELIRSFIFSPTSYLMTDNDNY